MYTIILEVVYPHSYLLGVIMSVRVHGVYVHTWHIIICVLYVYPHLFCEWFKVKKIFTNQLKSLIVHVN